MILCVKKIESMPHFLKPESFQKSFSHMLWKNKWIFHIFWIYCWICYYYWHAYIILHYYIMAYILCIVLSCISIYILYQYILHIHYILNFYSYYIIILLLSNIVDATYFMYFTYEKNNIEMELWETHPTRCPSLPQRSGGLVVARAATEGSQEWFRNGSHV